MYAFETLAVHAGEEPDAESGALRTPLHMTASFKLPGFGPELFDAPLVVDSTFGGPALQRPLELGADYVVHSLTKYLCGHGDALGGVVLGSQEGLKRVRQDMLVHLGGALSPFNAWLILRGLMTLPLRMERHCHNALELARFLEAHPQVSRVLYPGLQSHPHHELARQQMRAFGGMLTLQLKGGLGAAITLAEKIRLFKYATSLGTPTACSFIIPPTCTWTPHPT